MKSLTLIGIAAVAGIVLGVIGCLIIKRSVPMPKGKVDRVNYADKILLHMHPEKFLPFLPNLNDHQVSYLFGLTPEEYTEVKNEYQGQAKELASELLRDPEFSAKVDRLPFRKNETILVLGESTADALNSWVYVLGFLLEQRRPTDNIKVINAAISGQTTAEAVRKITTQVKPNPNWVICHMGANDCMRYGDLSFKTAVSIDETILNIETIQKIVAQESNASFVLMAPAPVNEDKISSFPPFKAFKLFLKNEDLLAVGEQLKNKFGTVLDMRNNFGVPAKPEYVQFDGGHLTLEGQKLVITSLVDYLILKN